jgi:phage tail sheath protein FI
MAETIISPGVFQRENDISFIAPAPVEAGAAIIGPTVKGPVEVPTVVTSYNEFSRIFGVTFDLGTDSQEFLTSLAVKSYFAQGGSTCLVTRVVSGAYTAATATTIAASSGSSPFAIETLGQGEIYNNSGSLNSDGSLPLGSADNLRYEISNVNDSKGTFTLSVRRGDDNAKNKIVLETFTNLSLDPNSDNYIEKVIGNQTISKLTDSDGVVYIGAVGEHVNKSKYIRISSVSRQTLNYIGNDGSIRLSSLADALPVAQIGAFEGASGTVSSAAKLFHNISSTNTQGLSGSDYADAITILGNQDEYLFNVISAPGLVYDISGHTTPIDNIISLAETRGDCIAVVDLYSHGGAVSQVTGKADLLNSSYAATYWPWLQTASANGKNVWVPASVFIPGVYAFTDGAAAPWSAPAGLVRGGIPGVIQAERKLTSNDRDTLYDGKVNPIATFPGTGIAVFGQKTLQTKASALDRVNVRRLLIELKKFIGDQATNLVFEQNTISTRNKFLATVNPYLDSVVQRNGLYAYRVVMDDSNNTAEVVDRNQLVGQIFIQPAKTAEYIILDFVIEPTGATFGA